MSCSWVNFINFAQSGGRWGCRQNKDFVENLGCYRPQIILGAVSFQEIASWHYRDFLVEYTPLVLLEHCGLWNMLVTNYQTRKDTVSV